MMTKRDYKRAADIAANRNVSPHTRAAIAAAFASFFRGDNPRFDEDRFLDACALGKDDPRDFPAGARAGGATARKTFAESSLAPAPAVRGIKVAPALRVPK